MDHCDIFEEMKSLKGKWKGINEAGKPVWIAYKLSANGTVIVEDWTFHNGIEALTLYSMDENTLIALHYCPIGNQPKLKLKERLKTGVLKFEFDSAMNFPDKNHDHEFAFDLEMVDQKTMIRNETYMSDQIPESNGTTFSRM